MMLQGKKILLGVCGSIAAYKIPLLVRLFVKAGAEVKIICTESAKSFVTPLTLSTLSNNPVLSQYSNDNDGTWNNHVELGLWADLMLIAPASANTLSKMANGMCDNLLLATYLSARCPVVFAPAMDLDMYAHFSTKENIARLIKAGNLMIKPGIGELASGLSGEGRMAEVEELFDFTCKMFKRKNLFEGKNILITAGPTHEAIDPVRFIGNNSSGKMGFAIAEELAHCGANVTLVCGPTALKTNLKNIKRIDVVSAEQMNDACHSCFETTHAAILAAAVADFKPLKQETQKIKKNNYNPIIELTKTPDILSSLGKIKRQEQILVGFALETENGIENARTKLQNKNLDFIVLNQFGDKGVGFEYDTNRVSVIDKNNNITNFELKAKSEVAFDIVQRLALEMKLIN